MGNRQQIKLVFLIKEGRQKRYLINFIIIVTAISLLISLNGSLMFDLSTEQLLVELLRQLIGKPIVAFLLAYPLIVIFNFFEWLNGRRL